MESEPETFEVPGVSVIHTPLKRSDLSAGIFLFLALGLGGCDRQSSDPARERDVYLLLVDTLRADHLSLYGYERPTSPNLVRFASTATVFDHVVAAAPWTLPSVGSVMTGLYPSAHGLRARTDAEGLTALRPAAITLAEVLANAGYRTVAIITNPFLTQGEHGLARGFEEFIRLQIVNAPHVHELAREVVSRDDPRPLFLYLHYMDPHGPYTRHRETDTATLGPLPAVSNRELTNDEMRKLPLPLRIPGKKDLGSYIHAYNRAIRAWDESFGDWIDWLDAKTSHPSPLITVVADHGEEFVDHGGWNHGVTLYEEQLSVPWILRLPGRSATRVSDRVVSLIDVAPTILTALGIRVPETMAGSNALGDEFEVDRPVFAETEIRTGGFADPGFVQQAVRRGDTKFIQKPGGSECYDLARDRLEIRSACDAVSWMKRAKADLARWTRSNERLADRLGEAVAVDLDPDQRKRLRAIGYLE